MKEKKNIIWMEASNFNEDFSKHTHTHTQKNRTETYSNVNINSLIYKLI